MSDTLITRRKLSHAVTQEILNKTSGFDKMIGSSKAFFCDFHLLLKFLFIKCM